MVDPTQIMAPGEEDKQKVAAIKEKNPELLVKINKAVADSLSKHLKIDTQEITGFLNKRIPGEQTILNSVALVIDEKDVLRSYGFSLFLDLPEKEGKAKAKKIESDLKELKKLNEYLKVSVTFSQGKLEFKFESIPPKDRVYQIKMEESDAIKTN